MIEWATLLGGLLGAGGATVLVTILNRHKTDAEAHKTDAEADQVRLSLTAQIREIYGGTIADLQNRLATQRGEFEAEVVNLKSQRAEDRVEALAVTARLQVEHESCLANLARVQATLDSMTGATQVSRLADKVGMLEARIIEMTTDGSASG